MIIKTCPKCKEDLHRSKFYTRKDGRPTGYCKDCLNKNSTERSRILKKKAIEYKGGKCEKCGYDRYDGALEFHHIDPSQKDIKLSSTRRGWKKVKEEIDKCILLCANCHREEHGIINGVFEQAPPRGLEPLT